MTEYDQLIVTLPNDEELTLSKYIQRLKNQVTELENSPDQHVGTQVINNPSDLPNKLFFTPPEMCKIQSKEPLRATINSRPIRTTKEQADYEQRLKRLKAKIAEQEYSEMTKNITSKQATNNSLNEVLNQVGSASKIAYSQITIACSVLVSIFAFFFIPIYALPEQHFPLGLRVGIGFVIASIVMAIEIYFYARAFMGQELGENYDSKNFDLVGSFSKVYNGGYNRDKIDRGRKKAQEWAKKNL